MDQPTTTISKSSKAYIPNSLLELYQQDSHPDNNDEGCRLGPSIAAVLNLAGREVKIDTATISHSGNRSEERLIIVTEKINRELSLSKDVLQKINQPILTYDKNSSRLNLHLNKTYTNTKLCIYSLEGALLHSERFKNTNLISTLFQNNNYKFFIIHLVADNYSSSFKIIC